MDNPIVYTCGSGWVPSDSDASDVVIESGPVWLVVSFYAADLPDGNYYYTLKTNKEMIPKKMVLLK